MDPLTARIWESSEHRGNALLLLILIGHSIAEGDPRPKLDDLAARIPGRKRLSRRQVERLESELVESQELQIIESAGRGKGNHYDIPAIRPLLTNRIQAEFAAYDARRLAAVLGESPTNTAGKAETPPDMTGQQSPTDAAAFSPESPTNTAGKAETPPHSSRIQSRASLSLKTDLNTEEDKEGGAGETETRCQREGCGHKASGHHSTGCILCDCPRYMKGRRRVRQAGGETPFPADFALDESDYAWAAETAPGLDVKNATASWADSMKSKGRQFSDWKAAWRNGIRMAYKWALEAGTIRQPPKTPAPVAPAAPPGDQAEYEQNRQLLNSPCSICNPFGIDGETNPACENCHGTGREPLAKILAGMNK